MFRCEYGEVLGEISHEDRVSAFLLGRHPFKENVFSKKLSPFFPVGMSPEALYPDTASSCTDLDSGRLYDEVPCHHLPEYAIDELVCPDGFLPPVDPSNPRRCLLPCPVPAFTESQYTTMWAAYSAVGTLGLLLNIYMILSWCLTGMKNFKKVHLQLRMCVFGGLLFGTCAMGYCI